MFQILQQKVRLVFLDSMDTFLNNCLKSRSASNVLWLSKSTLLYFQVPVLKEQYLVNHHV